MADKMSKTNQKAWGEKRSESLRSFLDKPITLRSSCSSNVERSKLPSIDETTARKKSRKSRVCKDVSSKESTTRCWLKPGISLPKMHGTEQDDVPILRQTPPTPSEDSFNLVLPIQLVPSPDPTVTTPSGCFLMNRTKSEELPGKVIGPSRCHSSFEVNYPDITYNDLNLDDGCGEGSPALQNWEKWMKMRHRQNERFVEKLKRDKCELVMNKGDCAREMAEEKDLLTYAEVLDSDKWRGNPNWWREPGKLSRKGSKPDYYAYKTRYERGEVPPLESVSVPDAVKKEKDVPCQGRINQNKSEYRKMREEKYSRQLKAIIPHKADARELVIIGEKIGHDEEKEPPEQCDLPVITVTHPDGCLRNMEDGQATFGVINLVINGVDLYSGDYNPCNGEVKTIREGHTWYLIFEEAPIGTITSRTLLVENRGTVAVRYKWSNQKPKTYHSAFPARKISSSGPYFFFDKNPGVFLPGQQIEMVFHHHSKNPGYHTETWSLNFNPDIFVLKESANVRLVAVAGAKASVTDLLKMDAYLDSCVAETIAGDILWEVFERAKTEVPRDVEYLSLFMEDELFEFQNRSHHYQYDTVEELKSLFKQISTQPQQQWDLNLFTLEDRIREYVPEKQQREMMCRLMELSRSLLRPGPSTYKVNKKHKMVYNALCSIVDRMEENALRIRNIFSVMDRPDGDITVFSEEQGTRPCSGRSRRSGVSFASLGNPEDGSFDWWSASDIFFKVMSKEVVNYRYVLHLMFFNHLCDAVELAAGVIQSCKLFEHHGEVVTSEYTRFFCDDNV